MFHAPPLQSLPLPVRLLFLFSLMLLCASALAQAASLMLYPVFGIPEPEKFLSSPEMQSAYPIAGLFMQSAVSAIGAFLLPSVCYLLLYKGSFFAPAGLSKRPSFQMLGIAIIIIALGLLFVSLPDDWNRHLPLPASMKSLAESQQKNEAMLEAWFRDADLSRLLLLLLCLAVLPALAEEVFFRATLQQSLREAGQSRVIAVMSSALAFSAMHFEILSFLPIFLMGLLLGFLYEISGNLWLPVAAHFFNNALHVLLKYAWLQGFTQRDWAGEVAVPAWLSLAALAPLLWLMRRMLQKQDYARSELP